MAGHGSSYFENSRRASLAQNTYASLNPGHHTGYGSLLWGLTSSDGPNGYTAHGIAPGGFDDGVIAPTAAGGSVPFTPEFSIPTLTNFYSRYRTNLLTSYGFRDAFNLALHWYDSDELGIDQGPIIIMIENYRNQRPWKLFMQDPEVQTGLQRAGFISLPFLRFAAALESTQSAVTLTWPARTNTIYQVEYSPDLSTWFTPSAGQITATNDSASFTESLAASTRFYRVFQLTSH
jgi:hypothetical protein